MNIDTVLLNWRKLADLSIDQAAEQIGIRPHTYRRIERGMGIDVKTALTIATWLFDKDSLSGNMKEAISARNHTL